MPPTTTAATTATDARSRIGTRVDQWRDRLTALSHGLHAEPETCFEEHASAQKLATLLDSAGFAVERGVCDLPTAFTADYGSGDLTIGICAEYDALPEIGHACGHNVIASAAAGAAIALAAVADDYGFQVKVLGTPAEEGGGGKILMLERGAFDDVTVAMMVHPAPADIADPAFSSQANSHFAVTFHGKSSHAAAAPALGVNAADAAVLAQVAIGLLRQQVRDDFRIAAIVREGGLRTNIIPERTVVECEVRTGTAEELVVLKERVLNCFRGAALATGTTMDTHSERRDYLDLRQDVWLLDAYRRNIAATGRAPRPMLTETKWVASTDMGNITQALPAIHPYIGILGASGAPHTREFAAETRTPAADQALVDAAKAMAWTGLDVALDIDRRAAYFALHASRVAGN